MPACLFFFFFFFLFFPFIPIALCTGRVARPVHAVACYALTTYLTFTELQLQDDLVGPRRVGLVADVVDLVGYNMDNKKKKKVSSALQAALPHPSAGMRKSKINFWAKICSAYCEEENIYVIHVCYTWYVVMSQTGVSFGSRLCQFGNTAPRPPHGPPCPC